jgi:superfamily II DNA or RNA helicase
LQLPTGSGKTRIAAEIIRNALSRSKRVIFVVPRLVLIDQTIRQFEREGITNLGVIQANHPRRNPDARIQIASAQTLIRREIPRADLVIVDENHISFDAINAWIRSYEWASTIFIGLSATPWAKGMAEVWDDLIKPVSIQELIDGGYLSPFRVFAEPGPDLSGVRVLGGDFLESDLSQLANSADSVELNSNVVMTWLQKGEDRPTLVYGVDRAHARRLQERFLEAGVSAGYIDFVSKRSVFSFISRRKKTRHAYT